MLKPLDIVIMLAAHLHGLREDAWTYASLSGGLGVSSSQVHGALKRGELAGLWSATFRRVRALVFVEFAAHGIPHLVPQRPGASVRGVPTAASWPSLRDRLSAGPAYVWPDARGPLIGAAVEPLDWRVPIMVRQDPALHEALAMIDALRIGRARERAFAREILTVGLVGPPIAQEQWLAAEP